MKKLYLKAARILCLAANDFKAKYKGSALSIIWALLEPIVTVFIYWFAYTIAFGKNDGDVPYYLVLSIKLAPWFLIDGGIKGVAASYQDYSYLIKKLPFDAEVLPKVRVISALISHLIFLVLVIFLCMIEGVSLSGILYLPIIVLITAVFIFSIGRILAIFAAFFKESLNALGIVMNIAFWITPIFWGVDNLSEKMYKIIMINPAAKIVTSYESIMLKGSLSKELLYIIAISYGLLILGKLYEKKYIKNIADTL